MPVVDCTYHGSCIDERRKCDREWMGTQCETCTSCTTIEFVSSTINDPGTSFLHSSLTDYYMIRFDTSPNEPIDVYGHPVLPWTVSDDPLVILLYTGGEYWIWHLDINVIGGEASEKNLIHYPESFHSTWDFIEGQKPWFLSEVTGDYPSMPKHLVWFNYTRGKRWILTYTAVVPSIFVLGVFVGLTCRSV